MESCLRPSGARCRGTGASHDAVSRRVHRGLPPRAARASCSRATPREEGPGPPTTRSRTTADATRDEATGAGASRDDAPALESTTLVRADAGTGPRTPRSPRLLPAPGPLTPPISCGRWGASPPRRCRWRRRWPTTWPRRHAVRTASCTGGPCRAGRAGRPRVARRRRRRGGGRRRQRSLQTAPHQPTLQPTPASCARPGLMPDRQHHRWPMRATAVVLPPLTDGETCQGMSMTRDGPSRRSCIA